MRFLTTASYYGTGSSAVTDLLSEYSDVASLPSCFECRIAHDMFGLSDLEYYLVDNYHRHNSSVAVKMFERLLKLYGLDECLKMENYPYYLGPDFKRYCEEYINRLAPLSYEGGSHLDIYMKSDAFIIWLKIKEKIFHSLYRLKVSQDNDDAWRYKKESPYERACKNEKSYITYPRDFFLSVTRDFTRNIFSYANKENRDFLLVDQLVPATNTMRYCRYFDSIKVVAIDRDPRDLYYLEKYYWKGSIVPSEPEMFVNWYKTTRAHKKYELGEENYVLRIQFEDLVFKYDLVVSEIEKFTGLKEENHVEYKKHFNPQKSKDNIGKWKNDKKEYSNIRKIEQLLPELCLK